MTPLERTIGDYFAAPCDTFWQWQDNGRATAWCDGKTIAFGEELTVVLKHLAPTGLPRFGSLLLLLAATRVNWSVDGSEAGLLAGMLNLNVAPDEESRDEGAELLRRVLEGLQRVRALGASLRAPLEAKAALAELVFEGCEPAVEKESVAGLTDAIRPGLLEVIDSATKDDTIGYGPLLLLQDLAYLAPGLTRVQPEAIRLRIKTGLDALPGPTMVEELPEELSPSEAARGLVDQLLDSAQHSGLARIAKQLFATTTLPRRLTESQQQETGGFSDIANRGAPDRLLLSELAQDSMTLAVRVAMNEAMYLHRELPPDTPRVRREMLIDSGVHAWGKPRVFAAAAALAFAATTPRGATLGVWRGSGNSLNKVSLATPAGIEEHLAALDSSPHLATALPEFEAKIVQSADPVEAILLIPADALAEPDFIMALRCLSVDRLYLATFGRDGEFRLTERLPRGEKLIRSAKIDLDCLTQSDTATRDASVGSKLPAIFRVEPFPLRMPATVDQQRAWTVGNWGALSITGDGRLLRWTDPKYGPEQLHQRLPKGKLWWTAAACVQGVTSFVYGSSETPCYFRVDIPRGEVEMTRLHCSSIKGVTLHNGVLFCLGKQKVSEMNLETGEAIRELAIPSDLEWRGGRFFAKGQIAWHALSHNGLSATLDPLSWPNTERDAVLSVWDAVGIEGPVAITQRGKLLNLHSEQNSLPRCGLSIDQCRILWRSADGVSLQVAGQYRDRYQAFEINLAANGQYKSIYGSAVKDNTASLARPAAIRNRFRSIGVLDGESKLALRSNKGMVLIDIRAGLPVLRPSHGKDFLRLERNFMPIECEGVRYKLSTATWDDGSRAVLDSRGLLHLQPADGKTPELSIVLSEGELSVWCSDGRKFGKQYFFPEDEYLIKGAGFRRRLVNETITRFVEGIDARS